MQGLPLTPAVTPSLQHRQLGQPYTINGVAVGPGEIPNGAGPFVNGGLHNTSDDSIRSGQNSQPGTVMFDPRGSQRSQMVNNMGGMDTSLESVGGTRHPPGVQVLPLQPLSGARPHTKLVPGRMSGAKSPGPVTRSQGLPARPESRTGSRQNNRSNIIPSTAV